MLDQNNLNEKLKKFIDVYYYKESWGHTLQEGCCAGYATLWLYGRFLSTIPKFRNLPRHDYSWFLDCCTQIGQWDGTSHLDEKQQALFLEFLDLLIFFQNISSYLPIVQGDLQKGIEDTLGHRFLKTYSRVNEFTVKALCIEIQNALHYGNMLFIDCHTHATAFFFHNGCYYFYDSNIPEGEQRFYQMSDAIQAILRAHYKVSEIPSKALYSLSIRAFTPRIAPIFASKISQQIAQPFPFPIVHPVFPRIFSHTLDGTALHLAAKLECITSCQALVTRIDPRSLDGEQNTPLHDTDSPEIIRLLYTHGSAINAQNIRKRTPLMVACMRGHLESVRTLLQCGADISIKDDDGDTALHHAENPEIIQLLCEHNRNIIDVTSNEGETSLMVACMGGHLESVRTLLQCGANTSIKDDDGDTALHHAENPEIIQLLCEHNRNIIDIANNKGETPLIVACMGGHLESVRTLLQCGADTSIKDDDDYTAEKIALELVFNEITQLLRQHQQFIDQTPRITSTHLHLTLLGHRHPQPTTTQADNTTPPDLSLSTQKII